MMVKHQPMLMPSMVALRDAQKVDSCWRDLRKVIGKDPNRMFNKEGLLCHNAIVDGQHQMVMPLKYRTATLYNAHTRNQLNIPEVEGYTTPYGDNIIGITCNQTITSL